MLLDSKQAEYVNQAVLQLKDHYPILSIAMDNVSAFSQQSKIEGGVYFAHAYSSYDRRTKTSVVY